MAKALFPYLLQVGTDGARQPAEGRMFWPLVFSVCSIAGIPIQIYMAQNKTSISDDGEKALGQAAHNGL